MTDSAPIVTILGASGFLGRAVVRQFAQAGWRVRAGTRKPALSGFLRTLGDLGQVAPVAADVRKPSTLFPIVQGARAVVNLVGILAPEGRQTFQSVHVDGATHCATAAAAAQAERFIQLSAIGADPAARTVYARTKGLGERRAVESCSATCILRPSVVFGPEDQFFNRFAAVMRVAPAFPVPDGGAMRLQPVYVDDVAAAVFRAATKPEAVGGTYELGGPRTRSLLEILRWTRGQIARKCALIPVPRAALWLPAFVMEAFPNPPLTRDQLLLLTTDNVVTEDAATLADLDVRPTAFEGIAPAYLQRFRPGGRLPV